MIRTIWIIGLVAVLVPLLVAWRTGDRGIVGNQGCPVGGRRSE